LTRIHGRKPRSAEAGCSLRKFQKKISRSGLQKFRTHDLEDKLAVAIEGVFAESDQRAAEAMRETVFQASRKLAGKFLKKMKPREKTKPEQEPDTEIRGGNMDNSEQS
jgi:hypothetical protein